jgi:hypothetical protein
MAIRWEQSLFLDDGQTGSNPDGKPAYRRSGKGVTYGIAGSQVFFRSISENRCDTVAAVWCLLDFRTKSIFVQ